MKKILGIGAFLAAVMLLLPLGVIKQPPKTVSAAAINTSVPSAKKAVSESFDVYNVSEEKIVKMTAEDYIFGVVAAEMPALYNEEALKAQAVAAYTFACYKKAVNAEKEYDITTDHTTDQSFISEEAAREKWGEKAEEYYSKIMNAIEDVEGYLITYDDKPVNAVYHAISSGKTEDCKDIWGSELPYLKPVLSEGDKLSNDYICEFTITPDALKEKFSDKVEFEGGPSEYFGKCYRTESGTVKEIFLCKESFTGEEIRSALGLRSANFQVEYSDTEFKFTVYGYGHGVGMSQNGANYMAKQGSNFKEILTHYYSDCKIQKIK